jgi:nitroimidazol reductase NimA-like FMN-containing flavoprotein (pyridoxamine 5'-phosphate oxidase superfamily)
MQEQPVVIMDTEECWTRLVHATFGRLAVTAGGEIDIYPINFVISDRKLYFRTAPGSKLLELSANPSVALEIDHVDEEIAYSVVLKGEAERLEHQGDIDAADRLPLVPWVPTLKYRWVRINPTSISGRLFERAPEPERY